MLREIDCEGVVPAQTEPGDEAKAETHSHRYQLTDLGRTVAVLFTKTYGRVLAPGLTILDPKLPDSLKQRSPLATAWRQLDDALDNFADRQLLAA